MICDYSFHIYVYNPSCTPYAIRVSDFPAIGWESPISLIPSLKYAVKLIVVYIYHDLPELSS